MKTNALFEFIKEFGLEDSFIGAEDNVIFFQKEDHFTFHYPEHTELSLVMAIRDYLFELDSGKKYYRICFYVQPKYHYGLQNNPLTITGYGRYYEIITCYGPNEYYREHYEDIPPMFIEKAKEAGWM